MWWRNRYKTLSEARQNPNSTGRSIAQNSDRSNGLGGRFIEQERRLPLETMANEVPGSLLSKVYGLLAFSLAVTTGGAFLGYRLDPVWIFFSFPVALGLIFMINKWRDVDGWNVVLLYSFCLCEGLLIGMVLASYAGAGMTHIVVQAGVVTAVVTVAMSFIGLAVKRDLSAWGSFLYAAVIGLLGVFVANLFIGESLVSFLASAFAVCLFSMFLIYDTNRIRSTSNTMGNAVVLTLEVYLDIINLFLNLLNLLAELSGDD
jgi:FtsH-binding integral membrane protein